LADNKKISELTKRDDGWGSSYEKKVEYETQGWLSKYLQQNLIKTLGTLTTVLGMIGIYAYHLHIEYFPVFDLKSTASLVFAAAYVGVFLLIFFAFFIVIPALYLGGTYIEDIVDEEKFPTAKGKIVTSFVMAGVGFFSILFCAFLLAENNLNLQWVWLILLPVFIVSLVKDEKGFSIPSKDQLVKQNSNFSKFSFRSTSKFLKSSFTLPRVKFGVMTTLFVFLQAVPIFAYLWILQGSPKEAFANTQWWEFALTVAGVSIFIQTVGFLFVSSWFFPAQSFSKKLYSLVLLVALGPFLTIVGRNPGFFWVHMANITKIGNFYASEITLTENGCKAVNWKSNSACVKYQSGGYKVCGVYILSRIGSETYMKVYEPVHINGQVTKVSSDADGGEVDKYSFIESVFLPSKDILGIKIDGKKTSRNISSVDNDLMNAKVACENGAASEVVKTFTLTDKELFEYDKYDLSKTGRERLDAIAHKVLLINSFRFSINIVGHADQIGTPSYNLILSQMRALVVENYMRDALPKNINIQISSRGVGSTRMKKTDGECPESMSMSERKFCLADNRRVEIEISSK
jgi:outer membrane protein OmpA-like peptidoglycan-associated protein